MLDSYIKKIIIHQFTPNDTDLIFSDQLVTLTPDLDTYFRTKLDKVFSVDAKRGVLSEDNPFLELLSDDFQESAMKVAQYWKEEFVISDDQKINDLVFIQFDKDGLEYFAFLRIALKDNLIHAFDGTSNHIEKSKNNFPSASQVPDDAIVINRKTLEYYLFEKRIKSDGKFLLYFSENILHDKPKPSVKSTIQVLEKTAQKIADDFQKNDFDFQAKVKTAICQNLEEETLSPEKLADQLFDDHLTARLSFVDQVKESIPQTVTLTDIDSSRQIKRLENQKLSLSNGIEMIVPNAIYQDSESVEFIQNQDGTYSILIKNIQDIKNK